MRLFTFSIFLVLLLFNCFQFSYSQERIENDKSKFYYDLSNGSTENFVPSLTKPDKKFSPEKEELLSELDQARLTGDINQVLYLQDKLDRMSNVVNLTNFNVDPMAAGMMQTEQHFVRPENPFSSPTYYRSTIQGGGVWALATFTHHTSNVVFAAVTEYKAGDGDVLNVYSSYDNGQSWYLKGTYNSFSSTVDYRSGELDLEVLINGADTIAYVVAGYNWNNHALTQIARFNLGTGIVTSTYFAAGGAIVDSVNTYNPKLTSDHTRYSSNPYIYITAARDSSVGGGLEDMSYWFAVILDPLNNFDITYREPNGGDGFYWHSSSQPASEYLWQDIAYVRTSSSNRLYTVFNHGGTTIGSNLYMAFSDDYGTSLGTGLMLDDTQDLSSARIAANGNNPNLCIAYRRFYDPDWDYRAQYSTTGGDSTQAFASHYVEYTSGQSPKLIDVQAIKNSDGGYVFSWANLDTTHYYRRTNNSGGNYNSFIQPDDVMKGDVSFGGIKAGYVNASVSDSSLIVWSALSGGGAYCSYNLYTPVGVDGENNPVVLQYSLQQNFPNPFNPNTAIRFSIPEQTIVKLKVFNAIGQEVATLINTELAAGNHSVDFNASTLSSGVYFYRIETPNYTSTKKMILMK